MTWLFLVFLASGFAALIYQLVWQRALFTIFGTNTESVAVIVTVFMLGLGLGSLLGGAASRKKPKHLLAMFGAIESGTGIFGLVSLPLFHGVGQLVLHAPLVVQGIVVFLLLLIPTTMMGATLPILVQYFVARSANVGRSVGSLYFINTIGAAFGALLAVGLLFGSAGLSGSVRVAAGINLTLGILVLTRVAQERRARVAEAA